MRIRRALCGLLAALAVIAPAAAEYPDKPIRLMAPYAPGGNIDVTARIIADRLRDVLGVTVVVENKAGASGMIGSDVVARSAPDGYSLLVSANSLVVVPAIYGNAPYDWRTAFQPISHIQAVPGVILVTPSSPIKSFVELIRTGVDRPNSLTIADSGVGTTTTSSRCF
jgi:tripartite-type tricarboxylate transporter receptor subunit TctC